MRISVSFVKETATNLEVGHNFLRLRVGRPGEAGRYGMLLFGSPGGVVCTGGSCHATEQIGRGRGRGRGKGERQEKGKKSRNERRNWEVKKRTRKDGNKFLSDEK